MPPQPFAFERDFDRHPGARPLAQPLTLAAEQDRAIGAACRAAVAKANARHATELEAACRAAREEGRLAGEAAGRAAARGELAAETHRLAALLADALPALRLHIDRELDAFQAEAVRFTAETVARLVPQLERAMAGERLDAFLRDALLSAPRRAAVTIAVAPDDLPRATAALAALHKRADDSAGAELRAEAQLQPGEARVGWEHGGIALEPATAATAILEICRSLGAVTPLPANSQKRPSRPRRSVAAASLEQPR